MFTTHNQRWRERRDFYRRPDEQIQPRLYEVAGIPDDTTAKNFVVRHHYSASYPAARFRFGLYERTELVGVAVFSIPMNIKALHIFPGKISLSIELGRFVLLDRVPGNGESWFLARCFELLREQDIIGVLSFSDPFPRTNSQGQVTFQGHIGTCYQATNGAFLGRSNSKYIKLLLDGKALSDRVISKIRSKEQGWRYGVNILRSYGASEPDPDNLRLWLAYWLPRLTRSVKHPGNYKYAWILQKQYRRKLPPRLRYPKVLLTT